MQGGFIRGVASSLAQRQCKLEVAHRLGTSVVPPVRVGHQRHDPLGAEPQRLIPESVAGYESGQLRVHLGPRNPQICGEIGEGDLPQTVNTGEDLPDIAESFAGEIAGSHNRWGQSEHAPRDLYDGVAAQIDSGFSVAHHFANCSFAQLRQCVQTVLRLRVLLDESEDATGDAAFRMLWFVGGMERVDRIQKRKADAVRPTSLIGVEEFIGQVVDGIP